MTRLLRRRPEARPAALLVVLIDCQDCVLDGCERQLLGPNGRCHRCGSGSFVYVGAGPHHFAVSAALASIERAEEAHQRALNGLRLACGLEPEERAE